MEDKEVEEEEEEEITTTMQSSTVMQQSLLVAKTILPFLSINKVEKGNRRRKRRWKTSSRRRNAVFRSNGSKLYSQPKAVVSFR